MKFGLSDTVIHELQNVFRSQPSIEKVLIFGSRAKGCQREGSDIDLAVVSPTLTPKQLLALSTAIDDLDLLYRIDLLDYNKHVGTPIGQHIDRVGQVFYQAEH